MRPLDILSDTAHILLYGTLRSGLTHFRRFNLPFALSFVRSEEVRGTLYDLGDYPGLVLDAAAGAVQAELFRIRDPKVLPVLDDYEAYNPGDLGPFDERTGRGSMFIRTRVTLDDGIGAWIYELNGVPDGAGVIAHGDWLRHTGR